MLLPILEPGKFQMEVLAHAHYRATMMIILTRVPQLLTKNYIDNVITSPFKKISKSIFWLLNTPLKIPKNFLIQIFSLSSHTKNINKSIHVSSMKERAWDILSHTLLSRKKNFKAFEALVKLFTFIFRWCSWSIAINKYSFGRLQMVNINCCIYQIIMELCNYS